MAKKIFAITGEKVYKSGTSISFKFMREAQVPPEKRECMLGMGAYGLLEQRKESDGLHWSLDIGSKGEFLFSSGEKVGDSPESFLISDLPLAPDAVLLLEAQHLPHLQTACTQLGIELTVHRFDGVLHAS